jgi:hypothetical protein
LFNKYFLHVTGEIPCDMYKFWWQIYHGLIRIKHYLEKEQTKCPLGYKECAG